MSDLHIVIGRHGFVPEQDGSQSLQTVIKDIMSGERSEVEKVLRITPPKAHWPHHQAIEDITKNVAWTIYDRCDGVKEYLVYNSVAYRLVEQHVGIAFARTCLDCHDETAA